MPAPTDKERAEARAVQAAARERIARNEAQYATASADEYLALTRDSSRAHNEITRAAMVLIDDGRD